jgi:hypothetical protein
MAHDEIRKPLRIFLSQTNKQQLMVMAGDESKRNTKRQANC